MDSLKKKKTYIWIFYLGFNFQWKRKIFNHMRRKKNMRNQQTSPSWLTMTRSSVFLPDDLITEILSFLPVKSLVRFRCVSIYWKTLISDRAFVKLHLKKSAIRNPLFTVLMFHDEYISKEFAFAIDEMNLRRCWCLLEWNS